MAVDDSIPCSRKKSSDTILFARTCLRIIELERDIEIEMVRMEVSRHVHGLAVSDFGGSYRAHLFTISKRMLTLCCLLFRIRLHQR